jgi:hypothetical protein
VNISKNKNGETQTSPDFNKLNTGNASKEKEAYKILLEPTLFLFYFYYFDLENGTLGLLFLVVNELLEVYGDDL